MEYNQFHQGIGMSKYVQNGFNDLVNCDVHSQIGSVRPQLALEKESGTTIDGSCYSITVPAGDVYFFSQDSGKIWKRTTAGSYSLVRTNTNGAATGAGFYNDYLYYATSTKLGRFDLSSTWNDNFQNLTAGDHPMHSFDLIIYIGNGADIAQLDDTDTFSSSGLDLPPEHVIKAIDHVGDDLVTLSNPGDYINDSAIFRWDTYSDSWTIKDAIKETDAYAFLDADNYIYAIAKSGTVYFYNGQKLEDFSKIRDASSTTSWQLTANYKGKPLIANGNKVYSLFRANRNLPVSLVCEYTCSQSSDALIQSMAVSGDDLLVAWKDGSTYGVDKIGTDRATAELYTPIFTEGFSVEVPYADLPSGTSVAISTKQDGATTWTSQTVQVDSVNKRRVIMKNWIDILNKAEAKITLTPSGADYPIIDNIIIR